MSESEKPPQVTCDITEDRCDHLKENPKWPTETFIQIGPMHIMWLCRGCEAGVKASVLEDILTRAARQYLPKMLKHKVKE